MKHGTDFVVVLAAAALAAGTCSAAAPAWKPDRVIEIIVNTAPGASPDKTARSIQKIMQEAGLATAVTVSNRVGGGGAVAFNYLKDRPADGHFLGIASKALLTNYIMGRGPDYTEFSPVAHLLGEYVIVCVRADSPLKTGRDLVERLKQDPAAYSFGIATSLGNINHQSVALALKQAGVDLRKTRTVVFQAATLGVTAMLGGHVDVVPVALGTAASPLQGGQIRLLAVAAPRRVPGIFAGVPTWRELGYDVVASNWRSVIAPKGLPPAQTAYWEQALQRVTQSPEWKKDLEQNHWDSEFIGAAGTRKLMDADYAQAKSLLVDLELAK